MTKRMQLGHITIECMPLKVSQVQPDTDASPYLNALEELCGLLKSVTWALAGGLAVPIAVGCFYRKHADIDIVMPLTGFDDVTSAFHCRGYELYTSWSVTHGSRGLLLQCRLRNSGGVVRLRPRRLYVKPRDRGGGNSLLSKIDLYPYRDRGGFLETCNTNRALSKRDMHCSSLRPFDRSGHLSCLHLDDVASLKSTRTGAKHKLDCAVIRDGPDAAREWFAERPRPAVVTERTEMESST